MIKKFMGYSSLQKFLFCFGWFLLLWFFYNVYQAGQVGIDVPPNEAAHNCIVYGSVALSGFYMSRIDCRLTAIEKEAP